MMKRPIIGISPGWDGQNLRYTLGHKNAGWIELCGGTPLILPYTSGAALEHTVSLLDGVLLTGGPDVSPELYGETRLECCGNSQMNRDEFEIALFRAARKCNKPVLGICKGSQIINTALGGTLYQDIKTQFGGQTLDHRKPEDGNTAPEGEVPKLFTHMAALKEGEPLHRVLGKSEIEVTTYHHQAVKRLADGLKVMATAPDGVIEAYYAPGGPFLWALQFHPEMFEYDGEMSRLIFEEFLKHCK